MGGFPKDDRFKYDSVDMKLREISPGPTTSKINETFLPNIGSLNRSSRRGNSIALDGSRNRFDDNKKIFFKELEHEVSGKDSPGFIYDSTA